MDLPEIEETNDVMCIILRKDGSTDQVPNGKIAKGDAIPRTGVDYSVGNIGCRVAGHAYTPHLRFTWTLLLVETP